MALTSMGSVGEGEYLNHGRKEETAGLDEPIPGDRGEMRK